MTKWNIGLLGLAICCVVWLLLPIASSQAEEDAPYGKSGHWENPIATSSCEDTQRCVDWHDDTDGLSGPRTACCVEELKIPRNLFSDCVVAFRYSGPRDEG